MGMRRTLQTLIIYNIFFKKISYMNKISDMTGCLFFLGKYYIPWSHTGTQSLDEMLPNVYNTTNETLVNIPSNLHLQLADGLISLGRLCT